MRRKGFTLIELLVVIAIIAILAAILFPVFARAQAKAHQAACLSNCKQLTLAFLQYAHDYDMQLPLCTEWLEGWGASNVGRPWGGYAGYLHRYIQSYDIWFCPAETNKVYGNQWGYPRPVFGYLTNDIYWGNASATNLRRWAGVLAGTAPNHYVVKEAKSLDYFPYPTHYVIMAEGWDISRRYDDIWPDGTTHNTACGAAVGSAFVNSDPPRLGSVNGGFTGRHNSMCNCLFLDGHVKSLGIRELGLNLDYYFDASSATAGVGQDRP